jgi:hypothetical protein
MRGPHYTMQADDALHRLFRLGSADAHMRWQRAHRKLWRPI